MGKRLAVSSTRYLLYKDRIYRAIPFWYEMHLDIVERWLSVFSYGLETSLTIAQELKQTQGDLKICQTHRAGLLQEPVEKVRNEEWINIRFEDVFMLHFWAPYTILTLQ